jgi:hypothetical protein
MPEQTAPEFEMCICWIIDPEHAASSCLGPELLASNGQQRPNDGYCVVRGNHLHPRDRSLASCAEESMQHGFHLIICGVPNRKQIRSRSTCDLLGLAIPPGACRTVQPSTIGLRGCDQGTCRGSLDMHRHVELLTHALHNPLIGCGIPQPVITEQQFHGSWPTALGKRVQDVGQHHRIAATRAHDDDTGTTQRAAVFAQKANHAAGEFTMNRMCLQLDHARHVT